jgi:hypothetical protein
MHTTQWMNFADERKELMGVVIAPYRRPITVHVYAGVDVYKQCDEHYCSEDTFQHKSSIFLQVKSSLILILLFHIKACTPIFVLLFEDIFPCTLCPVLFKVILDFPFPPLFSLLLLVNFVGHYQIIVQYVFGNSIFVLKISP